MRTGPFIDTDARLAVPSIPRLHLPHFHLRLQRGTFHATQANYSDEGQWMHDVSQHGSALSNLPDVS